MPKTLGNITVYHLPEIHKKFGITLRALREYCKSGKLRGRKCGSKWYVEESSLKAFFADGDQGGDKSRSTSEGQAAA